MTLPLEVFQLEKYVIHLKLLIHFIVNLLKAFNKDVKGCFFPQTSVDNCF